MTVQPLAAYCFANSRPMPWLAPVMRTVSASAVTAVTLRAMARSVVARRVVDRIFFNACTNRVPFCSERRGWLFRRPGQASLYGAFDRAGYGSGIMTAARRAHGGTL